MAKHWTTFIFKLVSTCMYDSCLVYKFRNDSVVQPSFNGALASDPAAIMPEAGGGQRQFFCVMNTIMALLGAAIAAFASSAAFNGKFNMVHIQNATLAGGVAIGSAANLSFSPAGAVAVGVIAGILSTMGFR